MLTAGFTLIVPSLAETTCTGLRMAGEKHIQGRLIRVELRPGRLQYIRDGKRLAPGAETKAESNFGAAFLKYMNAMP